MRWVLLKDADRYFLEITEVDGQVVNLDIPEEMWKHAEEAVGEGADQTEYCDWVERQLYETLINMTKP